jgi:hypothetical protein
VGFIRNKANVYVKPADENKEGGGAISARNADVHAEDCRFEGNRVFNFGGGAIYYRSGFEGGADFDPPNFRVGLVEDQHDMFDEIAETSFSYRTRTLRLVNCRAEDNRALDIRGAGGFLYAIRAPTTDGAKIHAGQEPMWVSIEGERTSLRPNQSDYNREAPIGTRKRGTVVLELSNHLTPTGAPEDRFAIGREVPVIATSTTSTAIPDARAVLVMPDGDSTHDISRTPSPAGRYVYGPAPTLTSVTPTLARAAGGTRLQLTGTDFEPGMRVRAGGRAAVRVAETATTVDVDLPPLPAGTHDLVLSLLSGAQAASVATVKVVAAPAVTSVSPVVARVGDQVTLRGVGLPVGTTVQLLFDAAAAPVDAAVTQAVEDELSFLVPTPPLAFSNATVSVTSPTGETGVAAMAVVVMP